VLCSAHNFNTLGYVSLSTTPSTSTIVDASSGVCINVHHSNNCQHNKQGCQTNFKALKIEDRKIETFRTLAAPQKKINLYKMLHVVYW
jgi:hypothetical protein